MTVTNTIKISEKNEEFIYNAISKKLIKLGFEDSKTHHFSFMGTRGYTDETKDFTYQVLFEFGNGENFFHLSCDLNKWKELKIKSLFLENQNL